MNAIPGLSACIITLNEEQNLARCLRSLGFANEIIVVDSGSRDQTIDIAKKYGARVLHREFDNYIAQKNFAVDQARGSWILFLDADEEASKELESEIRTLLAKSGSDDNQRLPARRSGNALLDGYLVPRKTYYLGQWIHHGGWYPDYTIRLFRKGRGSFVGKTFHARVRVDGRFGRLRKPILHYSYRDIREHLDVINRYSDLFAAERLEAGKRNGILFSLGKAAMKFLTMYFWKMGFLDGRAGLVIAVLGSYYNFLKYIKVWEAHRNSGPTAKKEMQN